MELDESMDEFKKPSAFAHKRAKQLKVKAPAKKKPPAKLRKKKPILKNASGDIEVKSREPSSCSGDGGNLRNMLQYLASGFGEKENTEVVENLSPPSPLRENDEDNGSLFPCKTCGKEFNRSYLKCHSAACLRANFELCRVASGSTEGLRRQGESSEFIVDKDSSYFCPTCGRDLSSLLEDQRNTHANRCLDQLNCKFSSTKECSPPKMVNHPKKLNPASDHRCFACMKVLKSHAGLKKHYVSCQKRNKFTTMAALAANRPDQGDIDIELLAEIKRSEERDSEKVTSVVRKPKKERVRKAKIKKDMGFYEDKMLQMALAVSRGDLEQDLVQTKKPPVIPIMATMSPKSKNEALKARMQDITELATEATDEIPSTPTLPPTNLRFAQLERSSQNLRLLSGIADARGAETLLRSPGEPCTSRGLERNLGGIPIDPDIIDDPVLDADVGRYPRLESPGFQGLRRRSSFLRNSAMNNEVETPRKIANQFPSCRVLDGELQSPEVSSSNIRNPITREAGENAEPSHVNVIPRQRQEQEVQCNDVPVELVQNRVSRLRTKTSKWTMTTGATSDDSGYVVRGLLSQFDKAKMLCSHRPPLGESREVIEMGESSSPCTPKMPVPEPGTDGDLDCTLMMLEKLENAPESSQNTLQSLSPCGSPSKFTTALYRTPSDHQYEPSESASFLETTHNVSPMQAFAQLLDNSLMSDAKVLLGPNSEVLWVHKTILYCRSPKLYEDIVRSENQCLFLPEFHKENFLPLMSFIYCGHLGTLPNSTCQRESALSTVSSAARRFQIRVPGLSQLLADANISESSVSIVEDNPKSIPNSPSDDNSRLEEGRFSPDPIFEEFLSQPSPTQRETPAYLKTPTGDVDVHKCENRSSASDSDCDMFECSDFPSIPDVQPNMSSSLPGVPPQSLYNKVDFASLSLPIPKPDKAVDSDSERKSTSDTEEIDGCEDTPSHTHSSQNSETETLEEPDLPDLQTRERFSRIPESKLQVSNDSSSKKLYVSPKRKHPLKVSKYGLRSSGPGPTKSRHREKCSLPCCSTKKREPPKFRSLMSKKCSPKITSRNRPHKSPKSLVGRPHKTPKSSVSRPNKTPKSLVSKTALATKRRRAKADASQKLLIKTDTTNTPQAKRLRQSFPSPSSGSIKNSGESLQSRERKKRSSSRSEQKETIYVSDILPRLKQREHIRSRPGVANMGKSGLRNTKGIKKDIATPPAEVSVKPEVRKGSLMKRLSFSQPVGGSPSMEVKAKRKYNFKRTLLEYASPVKFKLPQEGTKDSDTTPGIPSEEREYESDGAVFTDNPFDESFDDKCSVEIVYQETGTTPTTTDIEEKVLKKSEQEATLKISPPKPRIQRTVADKDTVTGPVPITPMPNFNEMDTPEIRKNAQRYGLKKTLGKNKIKAKLKEVYMYNHQTVSEDECDGDDNRKREEDVDNPFRTEDADLFSYDLDDLSDAGGEIKKWKVRLSLLSANPQVKSSSDKVYSFERMTSAEVMNLSSSVVDKMYSDHTLLEALRTAKSETGSIKRGSRQDQTRCWGIVTPGSSSYDPKVNAILRLPEEHQSAITDPLVNCVVKNYIEYKKHMFDCLPALCDRMEKEMG